mmetsp:Transcript_15631/g.51039  ORF Transcript_15631/g.51039 Transcript_15631/m.51039 type:complete len:231 (-) Transcript_15631:92-784(-)
MAAGRSSACRHSPMLESGDDSGTCRSSARKKRQRSSCARPPAARSLGASSLGMEPPDSATTKTPDRAMAAAAASSNSSAARCARSSCTSKTSRTRAPRPGWSAPADRPPGEQVAPLSAAAGVRAAAESAGASTLLPTVPWAGDTCSARASSASFSAKRRSCGSSRKLSDTNTGRPNLRDSRCASSCDPASPPLPPISVVAEGIDPDRPPLAAGTPMPSESKRESSMPIHR